MLIIATMMLAQAPVAAATAQPVAKKPDQVCQYTEVTGSHQRQKVCHDKSAPAEPGLDFTSDAPAGMFKEHPQTQPAASLGSPR